MLRDDGIDDGEAEAVASFLALSVHLETLDLSENQVQVYAGLRDINCAFNLNVTSVKIR